MRTLSYRSGLVLILVAAAITGIALSTDGATAKTEYQPVSNVKNIMNALNHEEVGFYGQMLKFCANNPARGDAGWALMRHQAALMAEGGQLLTEMDPPKGDPGSWVKEAEAFTKAAKGLKKPLAKRKPAEVNAQLQVVRKACDSCHAKHRPE